MLVLAYTAGLSGVCFSLVCCFAIDDISRLYHLFPTTGGGWGSGTIKGDDFFAVSHIAEDNDVRNA